MMQPSFLPDMPEKPVRLVTEPIVRQALISDGSRWWLKRAWGAGPLACWIMCNPSDADATHDDPTMLRVMEFSAAWGYGSCVVVNVIPFISSTPESALEWMKRAESWIIEGDGRDPAPEWGLYQRNIVHASLQIDAAAGHIVAWGNNIPADLAQRFLQDLAELADDGRGGGAFDDDPGPIEFLCLGTNSNGSPRHPLSRGKNRVPADFKPVRWEA